MADDDASDINWEPPNQGSDQLQRFSVSRLLWAGLVLCFGGVVLIVRHLEHHTNLIPSIGLFVFGVALIVAWALFRRQQKQAADAAAPGGTKR